MKIIISPAKKMQREPDWIGPCGKPVFLDKAETLKKRLLEMSREERKALWKCNEKIAELNHQRLQEMDLETGLTPALLSYEGIQYQYMAPQVFEDREWEYVQKHLRILSGFYGLLKPLDGVVPYRLEMQAKLSVGESSNLYDYWADDICRELEKETDCLINLASKEYSQCVEKYLSGRTRMITCIFGELFAGKIIQKGTQAKMARGEMVRFLAEAGAEEPENMRDFDRLGYQYREDLSNEEKYVFLKGGTERC